MAIAYPMGTILVYEYGSNSSSLDSITDIAVYKCPVSWGCILDLHTSISSFKTARITSSFETDPIRDQISSRCFIYGLFLMLCEIK